MNLTDPTGEIPLNNYQIGQASAIFGSTINYSQVNLNYNSGFTGGRAAMTVGNQINIAGTTTISVPTLLHELTHVWQFHSGKYDIFQMFAFQALAWLTQTKIYSFSISPESSFENYAMEQQAYIVEACARGSASACALLAKSKYFTKSAAPITSFHPASFDMMNPLFPMPRTVYPRVTVGEEDES